MDLIEKFSSISGLNINYNKTVAIKIGLDLYLEYQLKNSKKIIWQSEGKFTLLGIQYDLDEDFTKLNYENKIKQFKKI